jgi:hypothetical protein
MNGNNQRRYQGWNVGCKSKNEPMITPEYLYGRDFISLAFRLKNNRIKKKNKAEINLERRRDDVNSNNNQIILALKYQASTKVNNPVITIGLIETKNK